MNWFIITARMDGDDEDSMYVVNAETEDAALEAAELDARDVEELPENRDEVDDFYVNYVVQCGETKPHALSSAPGHSSIEIDLGAAHE